MTNLCCPNCGKTKNRVYDTRQAASGGAIWRRRRCVHCGERFTTYEFVFTAERRREFEPHRVSLDAELTTGGSHHDVIGDDEWADPTFDEMLLLMEDE
jgi:hypothetical protein